VPLKSRNRGRRDAQDGRRLDAQAAMRANGEVWAGADLVEFYAGDRLRPVEAILLRRYRDDLAGRVLELGCGAGRVTGHLCALAEHVHGVDLSPAMVAHCRRAFPGASFSEGDLCDLSAFTGGSFDAVLAPYNVLDVLCDADRREVLDEIRRLLVSGGLLIFSTHNRAHAAHLSRRLRLYLGSPRRPAASVRTLRLRLRNHRRLHELERSEPGYSLVNDEAHDFSLLHYYIGRDAQERQLSEHGFELLECRDLDARVVPQRAAATRCSELHYAARPT
jgi:SAM-dependent methyltransferase